MADMETGRYFIEEAAHLLAALRLWAQSCYRTEQAVREILETPDVATLRDVADQLRPMGAAKQRPPVRLYRRWHCCLSDICWRSRPMPSEPCDGDVVGYSRSIAAQMLHGRPGGRDDKPPDCVSAKSSPPSSPPVNRLAAPSHGERAPRCAC